MMDLDPLIKMAIIHYQFESIHPFYDGNGRTGRIINILYLVQKGLLGLPILYLSGFIIAHKNDYYRLLQQIRLTGDWEEWLLFMLEGIEKTAKEGIRLIQALRLLMQEQKNQIRNTFPKMYSQDLLNSLFKYPYTKIEYIQEDLQVSRNTAIRYLEDLVKEEIVVKHKLGRENYYENRKLFKLLSGQ
jgi:Fic family protein